MNSLKSLIWKPTPEEQKRKCNSLIRSNTRKLDRDIAQIQVLENKTKNFILQANRRAQRNPSQKRQANQEARTFAKELIRVRRQKARLHTSKAQLQSVQLQVNEAFSVRRIEGSIKASTGIMKDVNTLVRLPELTGTMRELSQELVKAGIIEEMVDDTINNTELEAGDEEAEEEVDKILGELLKEKAPVNKTQRLEEAATEPEVPVAGTLEEPSGEEQEEEEEQFDMDQMRGRLEALKS